jgi:hypothetical protein
MHWDAGTIMRICIGVFFLAFGAGVAYSLFRMGGMFRRLTNILTDANKEVAPILSRVEATLDGVNAELGKVDQITGSIAQMVSTMEHATSAVERGVSTPLKKAGSLMTGVSEAVTSFFSGRQRGAS